MEFFTSNDGPSSTECLQDLVNATIQIPTNPLMPQAHAAIFLNVQGIVGCFDPIISRWLKYKPAVNIVPRSSVITSAEKTASKGAKGSQDGRSDSTVTVPTGSISHSQTYNHTAASSKVKDESHLISSTSKTENSWGNFFSQLYPLVKIIQVQVGVFCCSFQDVFTFSHPG
jgi:hypothetical protein